MNARIDLTNVIIRPDWLLESHPLGLDVMHVDVEQRTPEWFQARAGVVTGSVIADVIAKGRSGEAASRKNLKMQKVAEILTGMPQESGFTNAAMQWGIEQEVNAVSAFEIHFGASIQSMGFLVDQERSYGASLDGVINNQSIVEIKCPNTVTHIEYLQKGELPSKYKPQVHWNMAVAGLESGVFISFDPRLPENLQLFTVEVQLDRGYVEELQSEVDSFLGEVNQIVNQLRTR